MDRNLFQLFAYDVDAAESGASSQFEAEPEDGYKSEGEEFVYTFRHDEDLPDEDPDSDEEYILTELGPLLHSLGKLKHRFCWYWQYMYQGISKLIQPPLPPPSTHTH